MAQDAQSTRSNKTASIVTCNSSNTTQTLTKQCQRRREAMTSKLNKIWGNFDQQKELAKMGYNNQYNLANLGFNQDMAKLRATQAFTAGQNTVAQRNELIKSAITRCYISRYSQSSYGNWWWYNVTTDKNVEWINFQIRFGQRIRDSWYLDLEPTFEMIPLKYSW